MEVLRISNNHIDVGFATEFFKIIDGDIRKFSTLNSVFSILNQKYCPWIIFVLHKFKFSAYWEFYRISKLSSAVIVQQSMSNLINAGIVASIKHNSDDYELILNFWKSIYPHSSRPPAFYRLTSEWSEVVKQLEPILLEKISLDGGIDMAAIEARIEKYSRYSSRAIDERRAIQEKENNSMGKCYECNNFILKTAIRGEGYHKFPIGLICGRCNRAYAEKRYIWMHPRK